MEDGSRDFVEVAEQVGQVVGEKLHDNGLEHGKHGGEGNRAGDGEAEQPVRPEGGAVKPGDLGGTERPLDGSDQSSLLVPDLNGDPNVADPFVQDEQGGQGSRLLGAAHPDRDEEVAAGELAQRLDLDERVIAYGVLDFAEVDILRRRKPDFVIEGTLMR